MKTGIAILTLLLAAGAARGGPGGGGEITVSARLDRERARIGDPVRLTLEAAAPAGWEISFGDLAETLGPDWEVADGGVETEAENGLRVIRRWYSLLAFDSGELELAPPPVRARLPDRSEIEEAPPVLTLRVESLLEPGAEDIRDIKPPLAVGASGAAAVAATAGALIIAAAVFYALRRRKAPEPATAPPRPADQIALEALDEIRRKNLPARGLVKEYYLEISNVARRYLENRFGLRAPERTTEEFLQELAGDYSSFSRPHQELLADFLTHCDLVKFARYGPSADEIENVYRSARRLVVETAATAEEADRLGKKD